MTEPRPDPTRLVTLILCWAAFLGVITLTLIDRGATRAYSTPWIFLFWFVHVAPLIAVALRAIPGARPFELPSPSWCLLAAGTASIVTLSALLSPYRAPSLLNALTPLAGIAAFFLIHDAGQRSRTQESASILKAITCFALVVVIVSLTRWGLAVVHANAHRSVTTLLNFRNDFPLGHSNYTAGLALLCIPWFGYRSWTQRGWARAGWIIATLAGIAMLFSSGSRGGILGAAALAIVAVVNARVNRRILVLLSLLLVTAVAALAYAHPRTRALIFNRHAFSAGANLSNVQRSAMATAGWRMGNDRPLLGWGPGTTPLAYPRYRAGLDGGVENALQLHSTPVQLWADFGIAGAASLLAFAYLIAIERRRSLTAGVKTLVIPPPLSSRGATRRGDPSKTTTDAERHDTPSDAADVSDALPRLAAEARNDSAGGNAVTQPHSLATPAFASLFSYAVFALTDYQLDIPVFTLAIAACAGLLARYGPQFSQANRAAKLKLSASALLVLVLIGVLGHRDPTPELNSRALALANDPADAAEAIRLLNESLAINADQEIAHFNLGWLQVVSDPSSAEKHFLAAAHLVPDKGGVYFGLALSRLNQEPANEANVVHALALECLNDPRFLVSGWWRQPNIAPFREPTIVELARIASIVEKSLASRQDRRSRDAAYIPVLAEWLDGKLSLADVLRVSFTPARVTYFAARPTVPPWKTDPVKTYRRERPGYPVLMRNLDIPPPVDLYDVQESSTATGELSELFPLKGWLPAKVIVELLDR
jgi:O-antigen ligase